MQMMRSDLVEPTVTYRSSSTNRMMNRCIWTLLQALKLFTSFFSADYICPRLEACSKLSLNSSANCCFFT